MVAAKQEPDRSAWWTVTRTGQYRLTKQGAAGLAAIGQPQRAGTFVSQKTLVSIRDNWILSRRKVADGLAARFKAGDLDLSTWVLNMRQEIKTTHIANYILGRGGLNKMTPSDWGKIGSNLRQQYTYLNDFAAKIADNPQWSEKRIAARSQMYFENSSTSFEQGKITQRGIPRLPQHPGDGNTQCLSNCKCYWRIVEREQMWDCYWTLQPAEHCPDCVQNSQRWNPLTLPKVQLRSRAKVRAYLEAIAA